MPFPGSMQMRGTRECTSAASATVDERHGPTAMKSDRIEAGDAGEERGHQSADDHRRRRTPTAMPASTTREPSPMTMRVRSAGRAPSAMRTPISCVRLATVYDSTP